jgi:hypothetical protein
MGEFDNRTSELSAELKAEERRLDCPQSIKNEALLLEVSGDWCRQVLLLRADWRSLLAPS